MTKDSFIRYKVGVLVDGGMLARGPSLKQRASSVRLESFMTVAIHRPGCPAAIGVVVLNTVKCFLVDMVHLSSDHSVGHSRQTSGRGAQTGGLAELLSATARELLMTSPSVAIAFKLAIIQTRLDTPSAIY